MEKAVNCYTCSGKMSAQEYFPDHQFSTKQSSQIYTDEKMITLCIVQTKQEQKPTV